VQVAKAINRKTDVVCWGSCASVVMSAGRSTSASVRAFLFKLGKYLTVFPFYLHVASHHKLNHSTEERINLEATSGFRSASWSLLIEIASISLSFASANFTQYRNRMQLEHELGLAAAWFIADEVFYDSSPLPGFANRMSVEFKKVKKALHARAYSCGRTTAMRFREISRIGSIFKIISKTRARYGY